MGRAAHDGVPAKAISSVLKEVHMRKWVWVFWLIAVLGTAMAAVVRVDVDIKLRGITLAPDRVVVGAVGGLRVVRFDPVREREADGVAIVYDSGSALVVREYTLEFERLGLTRVSKVDGPKRTVLTYRGVDRTFRAVFTDRGRETEVRVFVN
jgi:hypothetical protein